jgi:Zn-dependent protease with chaperone function
VFCVRCGTDLQAGVAFCHQCGAPLGAAATAPALPPSAAPPGGTTPRPLAVAPIGGYFLSPEEYISPQDQSAMRALQSTGEVNRLVQTFVGKYGKPWLESSFLGNGVRIGPEQLPMLYQLASEIGEILCLTRLPDIYVVNLYNTPLAIARSTRSATIGTDTEAFVVLDARLLGRLADPRLTIEQLREDPVCFLLASELAHVAMGHALWLAIAMWVSIRGPSGIAGLISRPLVMPLIYWARQAVLSADRAVVLATGNVEEYRRSLLSNLVANARLVPLINVEAYMRQVEGRHESIGRFFEGVSSTSPYISRRLAGLDEFVGGPAFVDLRRRVEGFVSSMGRS